MMIINIDIDGSSKEIADLILCLQDQQIDTKVLLDDATLSQAFQKATNDISQVNSMASID